MSKAASLTGALLRKPKSAVPAIASQAKPVTPARQARPVAAVPQARPTIATLAPRPVSQRDNDGEISALLRKPTSAAPSAPAKPAAPVRLAVTEAPARPAIATVPQRPAQPPGSDGITRVSLRINSARHRRLRIAAAHLGISNTGMMVTAINHYLDHVVPELMAGEKTWSEQGNAPATANWAALGLGGTQPSRSP